jgi:hypothetical protein
MFLEGEGTFVKLWHDIWCRACSLKEAFPELYHLACSKESSVAENLQFSNGNIH